MEINFFEEYDKKFSKTTKQESIDRILLELADQIHGKYKSVGLTAVVTGSGHSDSKFRTIGISLITISNSNYTYRLLDVTQPIDSEFDIEVYAFLNPPTETKKFDAYDKFIDWVKNDVIGNVRMKIVVDHIISMDKNINEWKQGKF